MFSLARPLAMYAQLENQLTMRLLSFFIVLNKVYESSASTFTGFRSTLSA